MNGTWLPQNVRGAATQLEWVLAASDKNKHQTGWIVFDNLRTEMKKSQTPLEAINDNKHVGSLQRRDTSLGDGQGLLESWEEDLLWGLWNDTITQAATPEYKTRGKQGLKVHFDFSKFHRPLLYAPLDPSWNLGRVDTLAVDVYMPSGMIAAVQVHLALTAKMKKYHSPAVTLKPGWNKVAANLNGSWLSRQARTAAEQVEWALSSDDKKLAGWVVFDNFRAEAKQR